MIKPRIKNGSLRHKFEDDDIFELFWQYIALLKIPQTIYLFLFYLFDIFGESHICKIHRSRVEFVSILCRKSIGNFNKYRLQSLPVSHNSIGLMLIDCVRLKDAVSVL